MENTERFEQLLRTHSYNDLSMEDKEWVAQFAASEEDYEALRQATRHLEQKEIPAGLSPDPEIRKSLMKSWNSKHRSYSSGILTAWSIPASLAVPAVFVVGIICWWVGMSSGTKTVYIDRIATHWDTVHVASKPDTIIIERIVYMPLNIPTAAVKQPLNVNPPQVNRGINMKEKEELEKLLVSGGL